MEIYIDVLVALNILVTYILLVCSRVISKIPTNKYAVALASFIGGISSLVIFFDDIGIAFSLVYKTVSAGIIVAVAFLPKSFKVFIKTFLSFFTASFIFAGAMYALEITVAPSNILYYNGTVYFNMSLTYLIGSVFAIYGVFIAVDYIIGRKISDESKCELTVKFNSCEVSLSALVDTGNTLTDGLSSRPVTVAELSAVAPLFTFDELRFFEEGKAENVPQRLKKRVRVVPCKVVQNESLLPAFIPDKITVKTKNGIVETDFCVIAVTKSDLSSGEYRALLNGNILENRKEKIQANEIY